MGEKRGKESSDEGSGGEKGSHRSDEDEKGSIPDGSSGDDDDYRQVRSKRQKLKEKKKRQKAKKKEDASRPALLLVPEEERKRLWILDVVKPSKDAIDQALAGHPDAHPQLLRLLGIADTFCPDFACQDGIDPATSRPVLRRLVLSPSPFTWEAFKTAFDDHLTIRHGPPRPRTTPTSPTLQQAAR